MNPNGVRLLNLYPAPNFTGSGGNLVFNETQPLNTNEIVVKGDYNINEKNQLSIHWVHDYYNSLQNVTNLIQYWREGPGLNSSTPRNPVFTPSPINVAPFTYSGHTLRNTHARAPKPGSPPGFTPHP